MSAVQEKADYVEPGSTVAGSPHMAKPGQLSPVPNFNDDSTAHGNGDYYFHSSEDNALLSGENSPGVRRIEAISAQLGFKDRIILFFGVFLVAYAYGLDGTVRYTFQATATSDYAQHSLLATINVLRSVIAAAAQPTAAKIADVFGRAELILVSIVFYVVGTIIEATSTGVKAFSAGAVLYQIGYTMIILLVEVIVADLTSLRSRLFFSFIPATPFIINAWVSGDVAAAVLGATTWQWGIGMWAIIYPVCTLPLLTMLWIAQRRAKRAGTLEDYRTPFQMLGARRLAAALFWQLDVVGIILLIAVFALILVPFTLAGGVSQTWQSAHIIAPLVVGFCCIPAWIIWEMKCPHPMIPFKLLKDRGVWAGFGIACFLNCAWYLQGDYLYTVVVVAFNESIKSATRITSLYSFASVITGTLLGLVVYKVRRLKMFILFGVCLFAVAFGLLIHFRGGESSTPGLIGGQIVLGIAGGMFSYPTQASVQAETRHEHVAIVTGLYLATYNIGSALGNTISGAIWTQVLPGQLTERMGNATAAAEVYASPFTYALAYPWESFERQAIVAAYQHTQRLLCITGLCIGILLIVFGALLRDRKLGDEQSRPDAEKDL